MGPQHAPHRAEPPRGGSSEERRDTRAMLALGLGNTLEWYDWVVVGLLASYLGPAFFEPQDRLSATLDALAVFAIGFLARPLGGVLLGDLADKRGRRPVLLLSIALMATTTLVIALLPTYERIGIWAGLVLVLCRLAQGLSTGIEAPLATAYAVELAADGHEGRAAASMSFFVNLGVVLASVVSFSTSYLVGPDAMAEWGWRVPLLVGAAMGWVVLLLRRGLPDASIPRPAGFEGRHHNWRGVRQHWFAVLTIVCVVGATQAFNYAWNVGLPSLARGKYGEDPTLVFAATTCLGLILLGGSLATGRLVDRTTLTSVFTAARLLAAPAVVLMLLYSGPGMAALFAVLVAGGVVLSANLTLSTLVATALLPPHCRATGVGLGYGVGVALFGGTASYLLVWLDSREQLWAFAVYAATLSLVSAVAYHLARRHRDLYVSS